MESRYTDSPGSTSTPAPWTYKVFPTPKGAEGLASYASLRDATGNTVGITLDASRAPLIAASPDLLAAARAALSALAPGYDESSDPKMVVKFVVDAYGPLCGHAYTRLREAIAQATEPLRASEGES